MKSAYVTSLRLSPDTPNEPLKPLFILTDRRSAIIDDFDDNHLRFFSDVVSDVNDPILQARIADLLWLRKKNYRYGELAIAAYLKASETLENFQHWGSPANSIERARQIAILLGKSTVCYAQVLGKDFLFDLRELLVERPGANLRNDMAHGLISHNAFYSIAGFYLWWLALRFYACPTVVSLKTDALDETDTVLEANIS